MNFYDIYLTLKISGYEKSVVNRVKADTVEEGIFDGFCDEVHSVDNDEDVIAALKESLAENGGYCMIDGDYSIHLDKVIELVEVPVTIKGVEVVALLPDPTTNNGMRYFSRR